MTLLQKTNLLYILVSSESADLCTLMLTMAPLNLCSPEMSGEKLELFDRTVNALTRAPARYTLTVLIDRWTLVEPPFARVWLGTLTSLMFSLRSGAMVFLKCR